ncbi:hypothetical protein HPB52_022584 [Rhipicephalus sanguineus]|uniref:CCHC-type domain-containing protein n=1 Tax=Rhipicephalus sanguineus TaxID=34632 RepID=A0A9D4PI93_RHISA|nr:hypothetical protein HPB52_022584 [Rhipicephalus sanguineus]
MQDLAPAFRDTVRIHPVKNTFTLSVADSARAQAYLYITSLTVSGTTFTVHLYAPAPDDALRSVLYHAFDDFTDEAILEDLQASNPTLSIVGGRRMGKAPHILFALTEPKVPRWILYHGVHLRLLPFHNKIEACFNCRSTGHRTDVCPKPRQDRCHRCCATHPPPPEGLPTTCTPCYITTSLFPSLAETASKAASQPTYSAWSSPGAPPALPPPQVAALQQENASLRQQLAAQGSLLEAQKTEITSLQAQLSTLEQKLGAALDRLSTLPSSTASASDMDTQPADGCVGKRKRHTTPLKYLHLSEEIQAAIKTAHKTAHRPCCFPLDYVPSITSGDASEQSHPFTPALLTPPPLPDHRNRKPRRRLLLTLIMADRSTVTIWQWNRRGLRPKRSHLLLHLQQLDPPDTPDVLVLQETNTAVSLSGYIAHSQVAHHPTPHPVTAILTRRTLTVNLVDLPFPAL